MRLVILFGTATLIALFVQTVLPYWLPLGSLVPDLVVILAVDLGLRHHGALAALMAFAMGYAVDAFSGTRLGLNAFMVTMVFLFAYGISSRLLVTNVVVGMAVVFFGVMFKDLGAIAITSGIAGLGPEVSALPAIMFQAALTAALAPMVFALMAGSKRLVGLPVTTRREDNRY